jgi:cyanate lyase
MDLCSRLPANPLQRAIVQKKLSRDLSWEELGRQLGVTERTLQRIMSYRTIGVFAADHMAIRLGLHPTAIWPKEWGALAVRGSRNHQGGETNGRARAYSKSQGVARTRTKSRSRRAS